MKLKFIFPIVFTLLLFCKTIHCQEKEQYKSINGFMFGFTLGSFNKNFMGSSFDSQVGAGFTIGYKNLKGINNNFSRSFGVTIFVRTLS